MASPSKPRLNTKTSDMSDFFRTNSRATDVEAEAPTPSTSTFLSEPDSPVRKRSSRLPFLGRQRKKSTQSDASASSAGPSASSRQSDADVRHSNVSKVESSPDIPAVPSLDDTLGRPLPALPVEAPTNSSSPSFGSKLAARFAPSRQKLFNLSPRKPGPVRPSNEPIPDPVSPPISLSRAASVESAGTSSDHRSITPRPRPIQPTITVSLPPDQLDGYEGLFTLPASSLSSDDPETPTTSSTPPLRFPSVTPPPDVDTTVKHRGSRSTAGEKSSSRGSRISRKHVGAVFRPSQVDSTDAEDSEAVMSDSPKPSPPMTAGSTPTAEKRRTLATMPYNFSAEKALPRSIMKSSSDRPHRPPGFPPSPPPTNPPSSALPVVPLSRNGSPTLGSLIPPRQRAQTLSSVPHSAITAVTSSSPASSLSTFPTRRIAKSTGEGSPRAGSPPTKAVAESAGSAGKENLDVEKASSEQLREALKLRNQQFDELASYLLKITEAHVAEKQALLKKVASLEHESGRLKNEIKGLTWLLTNNARQGSGSIAELSDRASKSTTALELTETSDGELSSSFGPSNAAEDSGAESHPTSGGEDSYRNSGPESAASGGESSSSSIARKVKRNHTLMSSFYRSSLKNARPGGQSVIPAMALPYRSGPNTKRSSISSFGTGTSSSSSTSSLSLGTVTPATTVISLGAIPEITAATPAPKSQDPVVAAAILATETQRAKEERRAKEDRRANRASNRLSAPSVTAPSASASYAANLKRGRPPSIAQVLAQSPKMEHGRDKLRTYTSGSASS
ncbi:hypothetical protein MSAN_01405100 [Mycena sanguinolenta]|uniref:Uncharacterized protein n=1 Tax=Mycena sanguinolenta TaxID=230812 RepID=A0A8H6YB84_9AGAR|nr:hypothetical protein MSAN_01405100 [Mycena sanguinolenta]